MTAPQSLETERLILRRWKIADMEIFAQMNIDPKVMEFFPRRLTKEQTQEYVDKIALSFAENQYGLWALEIKDTGEFIGYTGLAEADFEAPFTPCVEIGWRLVSHHWGKGYAPEAAREALRDGFERLGLSEIVALTAKINIKSRRVMEKIGMTYNAADDFLHPFVQVGPLQEHVLYRMKG